jgi:hypothetical protein
MLIILLLHAMHHLDWTSLPANQIIGPKGFVIGPWHVFLH